jgi:hypothetical protein
MSHKLLALEELRNEGEVFRQKDFCSVIFGIDDRFGIGVGIRGGAGHAGPEDGYDDQHG